MKIGPWSIDQLTTIVALAMMGCSQSGGNTGASGGSGPGFSHPSGGSGGEGSSSIYGGGGANTGPRNRSESGSGGTSRSISIAGASSESSGSAGGMSAVSSSHQGPEGGSTNGQTQSVSSTGGRSGSADQGGTAPSGTGGSSHGTTGYVGGTSGIVGAGGTSAKGDQGSGANGGTSSAGRTGGSTGLAGQTASTRPVAFGTLLNPDAVIASAQQLAKSLANPNSSQWHAKGDQHRTYRCAEANTDEPYRLYVPTNWDGQSKLPLVMFLHGAGSNENTYIDQNNKQLITLAQQHGFILVGPLGASGAYGNFLRLTSPFGNQAAADQLMSQVTAESERNNQLSEKDVINVLELVLNEYPVDRNAVFLTGHSMGSGGTWLIGGKYASYWTAIAPMSGPFVQEKGYPWDSLRDMPIFVTEGTQAPSLEGSRALRDWLKKNGFKAEYKEVNADHGGMVPLVLPDVFDFFERSRAQP